MQRICRRRFRRSKRPSRQFRSESNFRVVRADLVLHKMHDTRSASAEPRKWSPHSTAVDCLRQLAGPDLAERLDPDVALLAYPRADVRDPPEEVVVVRWPVV